VNNYVYMRMFVYLCVYGCVLQYYRLTCAIWTK